MIIFIYINKLIIIKIIIFIKIINNLIIVKNMQDIIIMQKMIFINLKEKESMEILEQITIHKVNTTF